MVESTIQLDQFESREPDGKSHAGCAGCGSGQAQSGQSKCGNGLEKVYPTTAVRFGFMRYIGEFTHAPELKFTCGAKVVVQTQRGIELGEQVSLTCGGCDKAVTREQMQAWVKSSGEDTYMFNAGRILREATAADLSEFAHMQLGCRPKRDLARTLAGQHNLALKVVDCECPLGGERIIFYFTAAQRVDFRALVKELAKEYRTRIEMRQIGARDEARLLADFETCGREVCCKVFLKTLRPISMRMAKLQKATLDPSQVSGRCGRLKCCLRYEHTSYEELDKKLPRIGARVETEEERGVVVNRQVLTQLVQIRKDDDTLVTVVIEDIIPDGAPRSPKTQAQPVGRRDASVAGEPPKASSDRAPKRETRQRSGQAPRSRTPDDARPVPQESNREPASHKDSSNSELSSDGGRRRRRRRRRRKRDGGPPKPGGDSAPPAG